MWYPIISTGSACTQANKHRHESLPMGLFPKEADLRHKCCCTTELEGGGQTGNILKVSESVVLKRCWHSCGGLDLGRQVRSISRIITTTESLSGLPPNSAYFKTWSSFITTINTMTSWLPCAESSPCFRDHTKHFTDHLMSPHSRAVKNTMLESKTAPAP